MEYIASWLQRTGLERRLQTFESDWAQGAGWYVEDDGRRVAQLSSPEYEDMFWCSFAVEPLVEDPAELRLLQTPEYWLERELVYRSKRFGDIAENAMPAGRVFSQAGRVIMRGLYLHMGTPTRLERFLLWSRKQDWLRPTFSASLE